ncbi:MAG: MarR family transcriptional regulator [Hamadaea sp.]|uniref:MarR family winged helix-turn-helix transcriptional regulator n=1 Tax=Hamadaea sp. TaxID=2024425 RepID=UPI0017BA9798|nr:MarR family transcriptional regulator [Hamadaea sp.]NUR72145.1 MarR family transcriptional regulator [Hamadaea sp.]NUT21328.1 MarR family transcriptional regulator [Hamadaea sp.]
MTVTREVVQLMAEIAARFNAGYEDAAGAHQLTAMQAKLLMLVAAEPQPMRRLADEFHCDPSNVTGIADRLERRGLVVREPAPGDRRVKNVALTPAGRRVVDDLRGSLGFAAEPLGSLTEPERVQLRDLLRKMLEPR